MRKIILAGFAAFTILGVWIIATQNKPIEKPATIAPGWETKEQADGNVTVSVTPITLRTEFPASFDIAFETHSVDLAFDVTEIAILKDQNGNALGDPKWDGSPPGGHHRSGSLSFSKPLPQTTQQVLLTLKDIAGVVKRTFTWEVKAQ